MTLIYRAVAVDAFRLPVPKKTWIVIAKGETTSTGWSSPQLASKGEKDDYLLMDFEAQPPAAGDVTLPVITPIVALAVVSPAKNVKGLIVRAESNSVRTSTQIIALDSAGEEDHDFLPYEMDQSVEGIDAKDLDEDEAHSEIASPELLRSDLRALAVTRGETCKDRTLLKVPLYPEFKTKGWKIYKRWRYNVTELHYCYPTGVDDAVKQVLDRCLPIAIAAGVAGFAAGGPAGAVAAFKTALEGCAAAEVARLVKVKIRNREVIGNWSRV